MSNTSFPIGQQELELLNNVLESYPMLSTVLRKCKNCELPADELIAKLDEQFKLASNLKAQFFPDQP